MILKMAEVSLLRSVAYGATHSLETSQRLPTLGMGCARAHKPDSTEVKRVRMHSADSSTTWRQRVELE